MAQAPKQPEKQSDPDRFNDDMSYHSADEAEPAKDSKPKLRTRQDVRDHMMKRRLSRK